MGFGLRLAPSARLPVCPPYRPGLGSRTIRYTRDDVLAFVERRHVAAGKERQ